MSDEIKEFPNHLDKFNWGAFFLTWIWGIGNNTWVAFWGTLSLWLIPIVGIILAFVLVGLGLENNNTSVAFWGALSLWLIPIVGIMLIFVFAIILGLKGNELAWKNKEWENEEHFTRIQELWAGWGVGLFIFGIVASIITFFVFGALLAIMLPSIIRGFEKGSNTFGLKNSRIIIIDTIRASQNDPNGINLSSTDAAVDNFVKYGQNLVKVSNNTLKDKYNVFYTFDCKNNSCEIMVDANGEKGPNMLSTREEIQDRVNIRIDKNDNSTRIEILAPDWLYEEVKSNPPKELPQKIDDGDHHQHEPHQKHPKDKMEGHQNNN